MHYFDPISKTASSVWKYTNSPSPKKIRETKYAGKVIIVIFFDHKDIISQHSVLLKNIVNGESFRFENFLATCIKKVS